jgi:hypothetical protein
MIQNACGLLASLPVVTVHTSPSDGTVYQYMPPAFKRIYYFSRVATFLTKNTVATTHGVTLVESKHSYGETAKNNRPPRLEHAASVSRDATLAVTNTGGSQPRRSAKRTAGDSEQSGVHRVLQLC